MAADAWELRSARLEGAYEQIDRRLGTVESRLSTLEQKVDHGFAGLRIEIRAAGSELRADIVEVKGELGSEIIAVRRELCGQIVGVGRELGGQIVGVRGELGGQIVGLRRELLDRIDRQVSRTDRQFYWILGTLIVVVLPLVLKATGH